MHAISFLNGLLAAMAVLLIGVAGIVFTIHRQQRRLAARFARLDPTKGVKAAEDTGSIKMIRSSYRWPAAGEILDAVLGIDRKLAARARPKIWLLVAVLGGAVTFTVWIGHSFFALPMPVIAAAIAILVLLLLRLMFLGARQAVLQRLLDQFPDALGLIVRAVRAGIPVGEGIRVVANDMPAPIGTEFTRMADEISVGVDMEAALWGLADRTQLSEFRFFVVTVVLQRETGGNLTETLDNLADVIRKRRAVRQRARVLSAEARLSIFILSALPFVAGSALYVMNRDYILRLFTTPEGKTLLGAAVVSLVLGLGTMHLMIRKALS
jgi:tight adherence protein B